MGDVDNFDIDIYGDEGPPEGYNEEQGGDNSYNYDDGASGRGGNGNNVPTSTSIARPNTERSNQSYVNTQQQSQGIKRKTMDERPIHPLSTNSVQVTELHWWITEDDVRGWCAESNCEDELRDITFNEHKVNGKSKGQVYIEFYSQAASTLLKHFIDVMEPKKGDPKLPVATFFMGPSNPYKTLPKDNARRNDGRGSTERSFSNPGQSFQSSNNFSGNFRGNRGGQYNSSRGNSGMNPGWNNRGGYSGGPMNPMGQMNPVAATQGFGGMNGFNNGNNFNRGGGMMNNGMRGGMQPNRGRGGNMGTGGPGMMNPMGGNMNMGMGMGPMGMNPGMMNMSGGFPNQPQFNQQQPFFQGQPAGGDWGNPHGAKRHRANE